MQWILELKISKSFIYIYIFRLAFGNCPRYCKQRNGWNWKEFKIINFWIAICNFSMLWFLTLCLVARTNISQSTWRLSVCMQDLVMLNCHFCIRILFRMTFNRFFHFLMQHHNNTFYDHAKQVSHLKHQAFLVHKIPKKVNICIKKYTPVL